MGTLVRYELHKASEIEITVFDAVGRRIAIIDRGWKPEGLNMCRWDGRNGNGGLVQSGVYFLRLRSGEGDAVRTMVILR
jgi:hypothetical protein